MPVSVLLLLYPAQSHHFFWVGAVREGKGGYGKGVISIFPDGTSIKAASVIFGGLGIKVILLVPAKRYPIICPKG